MPREDLFWMKTVKQARDFAQIELARRAKVKRGESDDTD